MQYKEMASEQSSTMAGVNPEACSLGDVLRMQLE